MTRQAKLLMEKMEIQAKFPYLIEVTYVYNDDTEENPHRDILRYANTDEDVTFEQNTYTAGFFKVSLPEKTTSGFTDASLTISNVDQEWVGKIRSTNKRSFIRFIATIEHYENGTQVEPIEDMEFTLTNATVNETTIQWTMKFDDKFDIKVPYDKCNDRVCPALV